MATIPTQDQGQLQSVRDWSPVPTVSPLASPTPEHHSPSTPSTPLKSLPLEHAAPNNISFDTKDTKATEKPLLVEQQWHSGTPRRLVLGLWKWELGSLIMAIGLMGAIIGLLAEYNGREVSAWHLGMNLSTLVALLSTVVRANIVMVVSGIISQLKWSWFTRRSQPLSHLQNFDAGSRTGVGAMRLVWMLFGQGSALGFLGGYAMIAAGVVILSFVVGPFMQQAIKTEICLQVLPNVNSSIPVVNYVQGQYYRVTAGLWDVTVDMKGIMVQGLTNPQSQDLATQGFCPTGNCTFPDYGTSITHSTLGLCSRCVDRTSEVKGPTKDGNITLPMGVLPDMLINLKSEMSFLTVRSTKNALTDVTILTASNSPCTNNTGILNCPHQSTPLAEGKLYGQVGDFVATTCSLYPCIKEYSGFISNGTVNERPVSTVEVPANVAKGLVPGNYTAIRSPCVLDETGIWYTEANMSSAPKIDGRTWDYVITPSGQNISVPNACLYKMSTVYAQALSFSMGNVFNGSCTYDTRQGNDLKCIDSWWLSPLYNQRNASFQSLSLAMDNFATAMTTKFRATGFGPDELWKSGQVQGAGYGVKGTVLQNSICMSLDWRWLLLPCALLAISTVLLTWMITRNYDETREPLWKSNILPLVLYGLGPEAAAPRMKRHDTSLSGVQEKASEMNVRCVIRGGGEPGFVNERDPEKEIRERSYSLDSLLVERHT